MKHVHFYSHAMSCQMLSDMTLVAMLLMFSMYFFTLCYTLVSCMSTHISVSVSIKPGQAAKGQSKELLKTGKNLDKISDEKINIVNQFQ